MIPVFNTAPVRFPPVVTWGLIAANCAIFLFQLGMPLAELELFLTWYGLVPARYFGAFPYGQHDGGLADYLPFLTNMFLHGGWLHLITNMWTLWLFGPAVEDRLGTLRYIALYLVSGVFASFVHAASNPLSTVPTVGASGAIAGVLGCFLLLFPFARLILLVPVLFLPLFFEVPAVIYIGLWFFLQLLQGTAELLLPVGEAVIAWWAHVGGFVAGLALGVLLRQLRRNFRPFYADEGVLGFTPSGRP
jgi:membrane associated rhomboid family serine protease